MAANLPSTIDLDECAEFEKVNDSDKADFHKLMNMTYELYGKQEPNIAILRMYFAALIRYEFDEIKEAINHHAVDPDQGQYLPKPADIVRNILGNTQTQAELAWTKVDLAIRTVGSHESVCFDDRLIHAVIEDMGGWVVLCAVDDKEYPFKHNEFIKRYRGYINRPPAYGQVLSRLIGTTEASNRNDGYMEHIPLPILIGDKELAMLVLQGGRGEKQNLIHRMSGLIAGVTQKLIGGRNEKEDG